MSEPITSLGTPSPFLQPLDSTDIQNVGVDLDPVVVSKDKYKDKYLTPNQPRNVPSALKSSSFTMHGIYLDTSRINLDTYTIEQLNQLIWDLNKGIADAKEDLVTMGKRWDNAAFFDKYPFGWVDYLVATGYVEGKISEMEAFLPSVENKLRQMQPPVKQALAAESPISRVGQFELSDEALQKISELKSQKADLVNELNQLKSELESADWYKVPLIYGQIAIKGIEIFNIDMSIGMWEKGGPTVKPT